jgi:hypothetical protein
VKQQLTGVSTGNSTAFRSSCVATLPGRAYESNARGWLFNVHHNVEYTSETTVQSESDNSKTQADPECEFVIEPICIRARALRRALRFSNLTFAFAFAFAFFM